MNAGEFVLKTLERSMIVLIALSLLVMCVLIIAVAISPEESGAKIDTPTEIITINPVQLETPGYVCNEYCYCMEETIPSSMPAGEQDAFDMEFPIVTV